ncbi:phytanoyl-CoA dioxygenase family protein [Candidatus Methylospira mobilis]|uniref:Phytanoyl-CoA dioxygenase family protein n=1 Tax=Candidatus Methylospira mobilis TaxID=1808979 RepID=A0A5Q0BGU2_9GAMM|nr:hypothetical protein [Candidatus Methylospira mobilis]QFY41397.1 phytanoyl-CoA dioxygenase family protein [Candidatus Methylospira mobilis]
MKTNSQVTYQIEDHTLSFEFQGDTFQGDNDVLLENDINLLLDTPWNSLGYTIQPFLDQESFALIKKGIQGKLARLIVRAGGKIDDNFELESYHAYVDDELHLKVASLIHHGWHVSDFPINFDIVNDRISEILGNKVSAQAKHDNFNHYFMRIVRPNKMKDNNPPHRDVWLDRLRNAVNIYAPLCGSTIRSSLPLVAGSHFLKESDITRTADGAFINETQYTVPGVIFVKNEIPKLTRPDPKENEVMIFSPYLIHGGGYNLNDNQTRMSLEIRFWMA